MENKEDSPNQVVTTSPSLVPTQQQQPQGTATRVPFPVVLQAVGSKVVIEGVPKDDITLVTVRAKEGQETATRRDVRLPWLDPQTSEWDRLLKHSLLACSDDISEEAISCPEAVPDAHFAINHDFFKRVQAASTSLHNLAFAATSKIIGCTKRAEILTKFFNIPVDLHEYLQETLSTQTPACGRFDFGYDGKNIVMFEYNCDSSGALLEASETQDKMLRYYDIVAPTGLDPMDRTPEIPEVLAANKPFSAGCMLLPKLVAYFRNLLVVVGEEGYGNTIHFMVDNDDEEKYTAQVALECAGRAGFKGKVVVGLEGLRFEEHADTTKAIADHDTTSLGPCPRRVYDVDGVEVKLVWKTWSWDTVLKDHRVAVCAKASRMAPTSPVGRAPAFSAPLRLSDVLLNKNIRVFEPFWKAVAGSKALLPTMYAMDPDHENMYAAAFEQTEFIKSKPYLSKPVSGRAGQNIVFLQQDDAAVKAFDTTTSAGRKAVRAETKHIADQAAQDPLACPEFDKHDVSGHAVTFDDANNVFENALSQESMSAGTPMLSIEGTPLPPDTPLETSEGRFHDTVQVYQHRLRIQSYNAEPFPPCVDVAGCEDSAGSKDPSSPILVYPIFCGWMVNDQFAAMCVREDTSRITKLASMVVPCAVVPNKGN